MRFTTIALAVVGVVAATLMFMNTMGPVSGSNFLQSSTATATAFNRFVAKHGKSYSTKEEYLYRKSIFEKAHDEVTKHNSQERMSWVAGLNLFSDMTPQELKRYFRDGLHNLAESQEVKAAHQHQHVHQSQYVDWRSMMNPVRIQGDCGSGYAFSAVAATEGRYAIKYGGAKIQLSEQQIVDCGGMFGCDGGWTDRALNYLQGSGAMSQVSYPYTADESFRCKYDSSKVIARVSSVVTITDPLSAIKEGPIGVYVQALGPFLSYQSGIFNGACSKTSYDHAVTAVGFGNENGVNYWILRDSLGSTFGEDGHIRVQANGNCYITFVAAPIVA